MYFLRDRTEDLVGSNCPSFLLLGQRVVEPWSGSDRDDVLANLVEAVLLDASVDHMESQHPFKGELRSQSPDSVVGELSCGADGFVHFEITREHRCSWHDVPFVGVHKSPCNPCEETKA